jgi:IS30 family transposase
MDHSDWESLPRRPAEFIPARQRHKILPSGIYTGDGSDTAFYNRRRIPAGLPPDATLIDCIVEVLRQKSPQSVAEIAQALNAGHADVQLMLSRTQKRFIQERTRGGNGRGILWRLAPAEDDPALIERISAELRKGSATIRQIAHALGEPESLIRLALRRNGIFQSAGRVGKSNKAGAIWGLK